MFAAVNDVFVWLFFAQYPWSPMGLFGAAALGWILRGWRDRREHRCGDDTCTDDHG